MDTWTLHGGRRVLTEEFRGTAIAIESRQRWPEILAKPQRMC
ncbi:hypothetical protein N878_08900 [Pseudomonas sp. EGD-AK9]|nr:hypothetical protein N878_08900 [Pseudomonas sp. EGD-AK9]